MPRDKTDNGGPPIDGDLDALIRSSADEILSLQEQKRMLSARVAEIKGQLANRGISRGAFNAALRDWQVDLNDEDRAGKLDERDTDYLVVRDALGIPLSAQLDKLLPRLDAPGADEPIDDIEEETVDDAA